MDCRRLSTATRENRNVKWFKPQMLASLLSVCHLWYLTEFHLMYLLAFFQMHLCSHIFRIKVFKSCFYWTLPTFFIIEDPTLLKHFKIFLHIMCGSKSSYTFQNYITKNIYLFLQNNMQTKMKSLPIDLLTYLFTINTIQSDMQAQGQTDRHTYLQDTCRQNFHLLVYAPCKMQQSFPRHQ